MKAIGVDIGGTNTRSALVDTTTGTVLARKHHRSIVGDSKAGIAALVADLRALGAGLPVGIAIAAQLDPKRRVALMAPNLKWEHVPLAALVQKAIRVPVVMHNDVRSAAHGELRFGALRKVKNTAAAAFWGSGVGGAVISQGRVQTGALGLAGEIGHLVYKPGGKRCGCGKRGCFEAYIGGHNLAIRAKQPNQALLEAAERGDRAARALVDEALTLFGVLVSHLSTVLDPEAIVIGGGLGLRLFDRVAEATAPHVLLVRQGKIKIVRAQLGDDSGILGAAAMAAEA